MPSTQESIHFEFKPPRCSVLRCKILSRCQCGMQAGLVREAGYLKAAYQSILPAGVCLGARPSAPVQVLCEGRMVLNYIRNLQHHRRNLSIPPQSCTRYTTGCSGKKHLMGRRSCVEAAALPMSFSGGKRWPYRHGPADALARCMGKGLSPCRGYTCTCMKPRDTPG